MRPVRPLPDTMRVRDLDERDRLAIECPSCRRAIGRQGYDLGLELPADMLLIAYVVRHYCRDCSGNGIRVRPQGFIVPYPRSGAESGHATQWAR